MEVQLPQQSVQINLNNKIITLHNVTIVKNPRIVKVDAAQYSNLLKGASAGNAPTQIKFVNGGAVKLPMPSLVPMKTPTTFVRSNPATAILNAANPPNSVIVNQIPVIKQATQQTTGNLLVPPHVIKTLQPTSNLTHQNGSFQFKQIVSPQQQQQSAPPALVSPVKIQTIPVKNTVIISPPKTNGNVATAVVSPQKNFTAAPVPQNNVIKVVTPSTTPPPLIQTVSPQLKEPIVAKQTSVITKPPQIISAASNSVNNTPVLPIKTNVIVSPPLKTKPTEACSPPDSKKPCTKLEFKCFFCQATFYNEPQLLMNHMQEMHAEKLPDGIKTNLTGSNGTQEAKVTDEKKPQPLQPHDNVENKLENGFKENGKDEKMETDSNSSSSSSSSSSISEESDSDDNGLDDDDESEVNDLIMDLENPQEENGSSDSSSESQSDSSSDSSDESDGESSQDRSNTPESPEFEEHVPTEGTSELNMSKEDDEEFTEENYDLDSKFH